MLMPILSGLIVSVDAFFIGISLGLQERCKFLHLAVINAVTFGLCILGFMIAEQLYEFIEIDTDLIVGALFISLGLWYIVNYSVSEYTKRRKRRSIEVEIEVEEKKASLKTIILAGLVMSVEAMLITMGISFIFLPGSTFLIPVTVALAHFGYSSLSFLLVRTKYVKRIPVAMSHIASGLALIIYGLMAIFVEIGI